MEKINAKLIFEDLLEELRDEKPEERSELARRYAIVITEIEKIKAYYQVYIEDGV